MLKEHESKRKGKGNSLFEKKQKNNNTTLNNDKQISLSKANIDTRT